MPAPARSRLFIISGILAVAAVAVGSGLDRISALEPVVAGLVPAPFAAAAHRAQAAQALRASDTRRAIAEARQAVAVDPIDPGSTAMLGAAYLKAGNQSQADRAFRMAARFGWRDPLTQLYWMDRALQSGEMNLAALRLDAVLRQNPHFPIRDMLLARFEASPEGRAALAPRLALGPGWTAQFIGGSAPLGLATLRSRGEVLQASGIPALGCETVAPLVNRLVEVGEIQSGKQVWRAHCQMATAGIADPRFTDLSPRKRTPFEWNLPGSGDISVAPDHGGAGGLTARVSGPASRMVAWQMLTLRPGTYLLRWTALKASAPSRAVSLSLTCQLGERIPLTPSALPNPGRFEAKVQLDKACSGQYLSVWLEPTTDDVHVDAIELEPIS